MLTGEPASLQAARAGAQVDGDLAALVEVAAYSLGRPAQLPDVEAQGLTGEIAAHALSARAGGPAGVG